MQPICCMAFFCQKKDSLTTVLSWSGKRDSNSRRSPWQGDALPLSHSRIFCCFARNSFAGNEIRTFPVNGNPRPDFRLRSNANSRRSPWQGDALPLSHSRMVVFAKSKNKFFEIAYILYQILSIFASVLMYFSGFFCLSFQMR